MIKKFFSLHQLLLILLTIPILVFLTTSCSKHQNITTNPKDTGTYYSLNLKVRLLYQDSGHKQSFKILVKFDQNKARMLFLGPPLNKIYAKLLVQGEAALLINQKKKRYWQGSFKTLIQDMWHVDFAYAEFHRLFQDGIIPNKRLKKLGVQLTLEKDPETGKPQYIEISTNDLLINLTVSNRRTRQGTILSTSNVNRDKLKQTTLKGLLEDE